MLAARPKLAKDGKAYIGGYIPNKVPRHKCDPFKRVGDPKGYDSVILRRYPQSLKFPTRSLTEWQANKSD
jgi:hypothetical protein